MPKSHFIKFPLLGFIIISLFFSSCKKNNEAEPMPDSIGNYIYAFTSGVISKQGEVKVRFISPLVSDEEVGKPIKSGLLNISPVINGEAIWEDTQTITYKPTSGFKSGTQYKMEVKLNQLFNNLPDDTQQFEFNFRTKEQYFDISVGGFSSLVEEGEEKHQVQGTVYLSDIENIEKIQKLLSAKQKGKSLIVEVKEGESPLEYNFIVKDVERGDKSSSVDINWNGRILGVSNKGSEAIEIPAIGNFKVVSANIVTKGDRHIELIFSDPLDNSQELNGLIQISNFNSSIRYDIDGNKVKVYPNGALVGTKTITVNTGIRNRAGQKMMDVSNWTFEFDQTKPQVRLVGNGVIIPKSDGLVFPFEAVNLNAVELEVFKIYENNLLQFLQTNELSGNYQLERVGRVVHREKVDLYKLDPNAQKTEWDRYAIDLEKIINPEPGAIYQVRLGFLPSYSDYFCGNMPKGETDEMTLMSNYYNEEGEIKSIMDSYYGVLGYYDDYRYSDRNNPCKPAYYGSRNFVSRNVFASNLGIIAKKGKDGSYFFAVSDLRSTNAVGNATINAYDYTQQLLATTTTNSEGIGFLNLQKKPYFIVIENGRERGYLKMTDGSSLSLSRFDVSGAVTQKGVKGFIYGERGVWRPGDTLFLNFILEDKLNKLPASHPVTMEIYDSRGQLQEKITQSENLNGIYNFTTTTQTDDPTGSWTAKVLVGGAKFSKQLKVETVKPNRLKVRLDFGKEELTSEDNNIEGELLSTWLHGAPASNLKAKVEMRLSEKRTSFKTFNNYVFDDPARSYDSEANVIFDGNLDAEGKATVTVSMDAKGNAPGKLKASFKSRVFEKGGDFSADNFSLSYSPYDSYAGINIPLNQYGEKRLDKGETHDIDLVVVDAEGKPKKNRDLSIGIYRLDWRWWWDSNRDNITSYNSSTHYGSISKAERTTNNKGITTVPVEVDRWGRYLVRVCDTESGHCTGDIFYAGYPWDDKEGSGNEGASMLMFSSDKQEYKVGDVVELNIPVTQVSKGLLTIENGTKVIEQRWFDAREGSNKIRIKSNSAWTPNVYAHVSLLQPHAQTENDLPIRMYGVVPLKVIDPKTELEPEIRMADKLLPEKEFTVEVKEKDGKPMAYTIAIVDEGLLDLTRFNTPNPWSTFYAREALGTQTWDMYDQVLGAYGGDLERILSVGGGAAVKKKSGEQAQRFKPVVMHAGPFYIKRGRVGKHTFKMPNYVGSVRTMVIAANDGAYGSSENTTPVRKPLMVLATVPRVLGPAEELSLPVNVFAMEKDVKDVTVKLETNDLIEIQGGNTRQLRFAKPGDQLANFNIKVRENVGVAKIKVIATSGTKQSTHEIEVQVRNPNPYVTNVDAYVLESGKTWTKEYSPVGMDGTNTAKLELSNIPPIDLGKRLDYLIRYPHGCIEQTTSSGFPQLFVSKLLDLNEKQKKEVPVNVQATIDRLNNFQVASGGFSYWPGGTEASDWGSNYGGHFILEAKNLGYVVPQNLLDKWLKYQKSMANNWAYAGGDFSDHGNRYNNDLMQAYRLYTLALAGKPEKGAMNRMRNTKGISSQAKWRLAAAYALTGKKQIANQIINGLDTKVAEYAELGHTYGSSLRDESMILETLDAMDDKLKAASLVKQLSEQISRDKWYSTQTVAYTLLSIGKYVGNEKGSDKFTYTYTVDGKTSNGGSSLPIVNIDLPADATRSVSLKNTSGAVLFARLITNGKPVQGDMTVAANDLKMEIVYKLSDGTAIDPTRIRQGTDFLAEVKITNPSTSGRRYDEMALSQVFPSGWEITNTRMDDVSDTGGTLPEYQDFRDDRVYTYFDINAGTTHKYVIQLNAAYQGKFYLPTLSCEAMYDNTINARQPGAWVEVIAPKEM